MGSKKQGDDPQSTSSIPKITIRRSAKSEALKALAEEAGVYVDAYRETRSLCLDAEQEGLSDVIPLLQLRQKNYHEKALNLIAGAVFTQLPLMPLVEGEAISELSRENKLHLSLGAAEMIVNYWANRPQPKGGYVLTTGFIKSFVRDFTRKAIIFGRVSRRKPVVTLQ